MGHISYPRSLKLYNGKKYSRYDTIRILSVIVMSSRTKYSFQEWVYLQATEAHDLVDF